MYLVGAGGQNARHYIYDASGTITLGGAVQLLLPQHQSRSMFLFTNNSSNTMYLDFGNARATCTLSGTSINASITITNAGFNYTNPPIVQFLGGGQPQGTFPNTGPNSSYLGAGGPGFPAPPHPARAHAVLTTGVVSSIVVDDPGSGYVHTPKVFLMNSDLDPHGAVAASASSGYAITTNGSFMFNGTCCPTDAISIYCGTSTSAFTCKYMV